jgi:hypothetical protein
MMDVEAIAVGCEDLVRSNAEALLVDGIGRLAVALGLAGRPGRGSILVTHEGGGERDLPYSWEDVGKTLRMFGSGSYEEVIVGIMCRDEADRVVSLDATVAARPDWDERHQQIVVGSVEFTAEFKGCGDPSLYDLGVDILEKVAVGVCACFGRVSTHGGPVGRKPPYDRLPVMISHYVADRMVSDASWAVLLGPGHLARLGGLDAVAGSRPSRRLENAAGKSMLLVRATEDACEYDASREKQQEWAEFLQPVMG